MSFISTTLRHDFVYFFGRLSFIKPALLNDSDRNRLLGTESLSDFAKVILELPFTKFINQGISKPEEIFSALQTWLESEIRKGVHEKFQTVLLLPMIQNHSAALSIALKKHYGFATNTNALVSNENIAVFEEFLQSGLGSNLPQDIIKIVERLSAYKWSTPQEIDGAVASAFAQYSMNIAKKSGSTIITNFVQTTIDTTNIKVALRSHENTTYLPGGKIETSIFSEESTTWPSAVRKAGYTQLAESLHAEMRIEELEQLCIQELTKSIRALWAIPMSLEYAFAFVTTTMNHINFLRTMYIGKKNDLTSEEINEIMPPFIPASLYV